eukprot:c38218_g1_i1 orf=24-176(-)
MDGDRYNVSLMRKEGRDNDSYLCSMSVLCYPVEWDGEVVQPSKKLPNDYY